MADGSRRAEEEVGLILAVHTRYTSDHLGLSRAQTSGLPCGFRVVTRAGVVAGNVRPSETMGSAGRNVREAPCLVRLVGMAVLVGSAGGT